MDIKTLESFKLSDAIFFHNELNNNLWDPNNKLRPEVKKQLLIIAKDFIQELGIKDLDIKDITISGSNAAYTYTPHSDLDLHILVDMSKLPNNEVYNELFTAKKNLYNDSHDITVHKVPVELYVQDSNEPVISLGEYSILQDKWLRIPVKRRANFDQTITKQKYNKLLDVIKRILKLKDLDKVNNIISKIKRYRQAGLDKGGEFSPENLAYKALRTQGFIDKLYNHRDKLHSLELSIEEDNKLLNKPTMTPSELATKYGVSKMDILKQLDMGIKVELEHTNNREVAREIALDHLGEDPNYYTKLKKLNLEDTAKVTLNELGNVYYPFKVVNKSDDLLIIESSKGELILYMTKPSDDTILIEFSVGGRYDITGEGNALIIFSTVKKMLETELPNFIDSNVKFITFSAEKIEPSRVKLYDKTVPVISKILGNSWKYEPKQDQDSSLKYYTWKREVTIEEAISETHDLLNEFTAYHGTFRPRLARFKPLSHFGTERAALERGGLKDRQFRGAISEMPDTSGPVGVQPGGWRTYKPRTVEEGNLSETTPKSNFVYHITPTKNLKSIAKYGLNPTIGDRSSQIVGEKTGIYVFPDKRSAEDAVVNWLGDEFDDEPLSMLKIDIFGLEDNISKGADYELIVDTVIEPKRIKKVNVSLEEGASGYIPNKLDIDYYMNEGCGVFAVAKALNSPGAKIYIISNNGGESWSNNFPYEITHVFVHIPNQGTFDVKGNRIPEQMASDFHLSKNDYSIKGPFSPKEFYIKFMGNSDAKPLYGTKKEINQLQKQLQLSNKVTEASGYIPSEKEKNDPRYKTALTVDIKPNTLKKNAQKLGSKISRAGIPPTLKANGKM